jgi:hypothetical protein
MDLKPEALESNGYVLMERLEHMELIPFVRLYMGNEPALPFYIPFVMYWYPFYSYFFMNLFICWRISHRAPCILLTMQISRNFIFFSMRKRNEH